MAAIRRVASQYARCVIVFLFLALAIPCWAITEAQSPTSRDIDRADPEQRRLELEKLALETAGLRAQQTDAARARADLEREKLELEVRALERQQQVPAWFTAVLGILGGILGTGGTLWIARRTRAGTLDQAVHEKRLEKYPELVNAGAPLAIYFPNYGLYGGPIAPRHCRAMGHAMSDWYFSGGGLLLSEQARDAYFKFARALTRASQASSLGAPTFPRDADDISSDNLKKYRDALSITERTDVETWPFGAQPGDSAPREQRFRDYVFLQFLSSDLRTALAEDLRSRRRPS